MIRLRQTTEDRIEQRLRHQRIQLIGEELFRIIDIDQESKAIRMSPSRRFTPISPDAFSVARRELSDVRAFRRRSGEIVDWRATSEEEEEEGSLEQLTLNRFAGHGEWVRLLTQEVRLKLNLLQIEEQQLFVNRLHPPRSPFAQRLQIGDGKAKMKQTGRSSDREHRQGFTAAGALRRSARSLTREREWGWVGEREGGRVHCFDRHEEWSRFDRWSKHRNRFDTGRDECSHHWRGARRPVDGWTSCSISSSKHRRRSPTSLGKTNKPCSHWYRSSSPRSESTIELRCKALETRTWNPCYFHSHDWTRVTRRERNNSQLNSPVRSSLDWRPLAWFHCSNSGERWCSRAGDIHRDPPHPVEPPNPNRGNSPPTAEWSQWSMVCRGVYDENEDPLDPGSSSHLREMILGTGLGVFQSMLVDLSLVEHARCVDRGDVREVGVGELA